MTLLYFESRHYHITEIEHDHFFRLALKDGAVIAVCDCGKELTAREIEDWINSKG